VYAGAGLEAGYYHDWQDSKRLDLFVQVQRVAQTATATAPAGPRFAFA
jgi:hypothetical protein